MNSKAQGTIEYLVILAIIVGIALVVVSVLSGFTNSGVGVSEKQSQMNSISQTIGVTEAITGTDNNTTLIILKSMKGETITVTKIEADGTTNFVGKQLTPGGELSVGVEELSNTCSCVGVPVGTNKDCEIKIYYTTGSGITSADGSITNSYNTGKVIGLTPVGGVESNLNVGRTIKNSFSTGTIIGTNPSRNFGTVGYNLGTVINLYWFDSNALDSATGCYYEGDANCTKLTSVDYNLLFLPTTDLYDSVEPYWTFGVDGNWTARDNDYPILTWQTE